MNSRAAYPPSYHHATTIVTPAAAQEQLAAFLAKTPTTAYLHPDAILSQTGIQFPAQSGAQGGLALHHLRRIAAGLRGENLIAETNEDLRSLFASEEKGPPAGDDGRLDALIGERPSKRMKGAQKVEKWQDEDAMDPTEYALLDKDGPMDPEEYALQQDDVEQEMGAEVLGTSGEQVSSAPRVEATGKSGAEKAARKAAKKAKKQQQRAAAAQSTAG